MRFPHHAFMILMLLAGARARANAQNLIACKGSSDFDGSPVLAIVADLGSAYKISIQTAIDSVESATEVIRTSEGGFEVSDNNFKMSFSVSPGVTTSPVHAFRDGQFFVEDFSCSLFQSIFDQSIPATHPTGLILKSK